MIDDAASSLTLLARARCGDRAAIELLVRRYRPRLRRWARGRLPARARDLADTSDIVQETIFQTFRQIDRFDVRGEGALQAYLRQAVMNRIRNECRRVSRAPERCELDVEQPAAGPSPLEVAVGHQFLERYERGLLTLKEDDRHIIIGRLEMTLSFEELATAMGKPTAAAARKAFSRALLRLACLLEPGT
jgi:RNA polymerase sigma-70 factor (ECF subfamily)